MKKLAFIFLFCPIFIFAQQPTWWNADSRKIHYPLEDYFIGYAVNTISPNEPSAKALKIVQDAARVEVASTIKTSVVNTTIETTRESMRQSLRGIEDSFSDEIESITKISTEMEIPGLHVESYQQGNQLAAFAYVKKSELIRQLEKTILTNLYKIEFRLDNADELILQGQKVEVKKVVQSLQDDFIKVDQLQQLLIDANPFVQEDELQLELTKKCQRRYLGIMIDIKKGIRLFVSCKADVFGQSFHQFSDWIKKDLSIEGITFVDNPKDADWIINISAKSREGNVSVIGSYSTYYSYVDTKLNIENSVSKVCVYDGVITQKGGNPSNYNSAAEQGYKQIAPQLSKIINEKVLY